jgi:putative transposon-encoded protein
MAIEMNTTQCVGTILKKLRGKNAFLIEVVLTGDVTKVAGGEKVIVPRKYVTVVQDPALGGGGEFAAFKIEDYTAKVT